MRLTLFFSKSRLLLLMRVLQLVCGVMILLFGTGIWLDVWLWDVSHGSSVEPAEIALVFLMFVLPGLMVAIGSYQQTVRYKVWAILLVVIGVCAAAPFVGMNALFVYAYTGHKWGIRAVLIDLCFIALTLVLAIANAILRKPATKLALHAQHR